MVDNISLDDLKKEEVKAEPVKTEVTPPSQDILPSQQLGNLTKVDSGDILPYKNKVGESRQHNMDKIMGDLDAAIDRNKRELYNDIIAPMQEQMINKGIDSSLGLEAGSVDTDQDTLDPDLEDTEPIKLTKVSTEVLNFSEVLQNNDVDEADDNIADPTPSLSLEASKDKDAPTFASDDDINFLIADDDDDLFSDDDPDNIHKKTSDAELKEDEKKAEELKADIREKIVPITNVLDLSKYKINSKPVSVSKIMSRQPVESGFDWVLHSAEKHIIMSAFHGTEIDKLAAGDPSRRRAASLSEYVEMFQTIYDHIKCVDKPSTMEAWAKTVYFDDLDDLYFNIYGASFARSNFLPFNCSKCKRAFMEQIDIYSMVKYANDEIKEKVDTILKTEPSAGNTLEVTIKQISDNYAVSYRRPTVYNVIFENAVIDDKFRRKYSNLLQLLAYIDNIYYINPEDQSLNPINTRPDSKSLTKTVKRRIAIYNEIFKTFTSDQFWAMMLDINQIATKGANDITYRVPEVKCKYCGETIEGFEEEPLNILFTRHQLVALLSSSAE